MCTLCGVQGGAGHWTDAVARPGVFTRTATTVERRRGRVVWFLQLNTVLRLYCFFFSSRRRHTISLCDWSSDVCSSDLPRRDPCFLPHRRACADLPACA